MVIQSDAEFDEEHRPRVLVEPPIVKKIKALDQEHQRKSSQSTPEIDENAFLSFLQQGGSIEPSFKWEIESLPDNGGIYRIILKGGRNEKSTRNNPCE